MNFVCGNKGVLTILKSETNKELYKGECNASVEDYNITLTVVEEIDFRNRTKRRRKQIERARNKLGF